MKPETAQSKQRIKFVTLGCKVNQYETQGMRELFEEQGWSEADGGHCDCVVINTCTVTAEADRVNRYWIRRMARRHPNAKIVVTGCYAERNHEDLRCMGEVTSVLPNRRKADIVQAVSGESTGAAAEPWAFGISRFSGRTRALVKVQDGCNHACSFCKVVLARGRSRSRPMAAILAEVQRLAQAGYREIVLTGIQLGAYGLDFSGGPSLAELTAACSEVPGIRRIRLSAIEPTDVGPELTNLMKHNDRICPHLHIPLQSGDDEVLRRMNRRYRSSFYAALIEKLRQEVPDFTLTLDVMAGFPGETESAFENTVALLDRVRPLKCHVFPYSAREGTRAARWENLPPETVTRRAKRLSAEAERIAAGVRRSFLGRRMEVVPERFSRGSSHGFTPNYLSVRFFSPPSAPAVTVKLDRLSGQEFIAEPAGAERGRDERGL